MRKTISVVLVVLLLVFSVSVLGCRPHNRGGSYVVYENGQYVQSVPQTYYPQTYPVQQPYYQYQQYQPVYQTYQQPYAYRVPQYRSSYWPSQRYYYGPSSTYNPRRFEGPPNLSFHQGPSGPASYYNPRRFEGPPNTVFHGGPWGPSSNYNPRCYERPPCR